MEAQADTVTTTNHVTIRIDEDEDDGTSSSVTTTNHVAIRIDEDDDQDDGTSCAVCMEPSEWVIVGACGHREVCLYCGVRMRFFQVDRRCCICRAFCATVVVTRANNPQQAVIDDGGGDGGQAHCHRQSVFSETSPAFGGIRPAAGTTHCWYHGGMAAYFDDPAPYKEVRDMCSKPLPLPSPLPPTGTVGNNHGGAPQDPNMELKSFLLYLAAAALGGAAGLGIPFATLMTHWLPRVAAVVGSGLLAAACAYLDARRWWFSTFPESDAQQ